MTSAHDLLRRMFDESCESLDRVVSGLDDDEYLWEPAPGCWTIRPRPEDWAGSPDGLGEWTMDNEDPEPHPAPLTTIAWRICRLAGINDVFYDHAFGSARMTFGLACPSSAAAATAWLRRSWQPLRDVVHHPAFDPDGWCRHNSGERWPLHRIFGTLVNEQVHHGAAISLLRDLYRRGPVDSAPL